MKQLSRKRREGRVALWPSRLGRAVFALAGIAALAVWAWTLDPVPPALSGEPAVGGESTFEAGFFRPAPEPTGDVRFIGPRRSVARFQAASAVAVAPASGGEARAVVPVSIELVLAVDSSLSVDDREFQLQMAGIAGAFREPEIIDLIGQQNGVAVTLFQWSEKIDTQRMIPWHLLSDAPSILSFAAKVANVERDPARQMTSIGSAIDFGVRLIAENAYDGRRLKIDISGDGRENVAPLLFQARRRAAALGIEINGLPILEDTYGLDIYYRVNVISGPGAFVEIAEDYDDFTRAFLRKLRREVTPSISRNQSPPRYRALSSAR